MAEILGTVTSQWLPVMGSWMGSAMAIDGVVLIARRASLAASQMSMDISDIVVETLRDVVGLGRLVRRRVHEFWGSACLVVVE